MIAIFVPHVTYFYIFYRMSLKEDILSQYHSLPPKIQSYVRFLNNNIRQKDTQGQLQRICFSYAIYISVHSWSCQYPYSIMITASHNPPNENGLKIQELGPNKPFNIEQFKAILNDQKRFEAFVIQFNDNLQKKQQSKPVDFFIGRDTRQTSGGLSKIIIRALEMTGSKVVDLGEGSTPQILSLSQYIYQRILFLPEFSVEEGRRSYFKEIQTSWRRAVDIFVNQTGRQWQQKSVYLDFSNGVGAIQALNYDFLKEYFHITKAYDKEFDKPNVDCGAKWIHSERLNLSSISLPEADHYIWFDGDADRILAKLKNDNQLTEGEDFTVCFIEFIKTLLSDLQHDLTLSCVSNIIVNSGLVHYLEKQKITHELACVGIRNLYKKAKNSDISVYFQCNGHGCIYFSDKALTLFKSLQKTSWQAELLLLINNFCRNNAKGYSFHNFLVFELYLFFTGQEKSIFFQKDYSTDKLYDLDKPNLFVNCKDGLKLLEKPQALVEEINNLRLKYSELYIKIRRASTEQMLRLSIQGKENLCKEVIPILDAIIQKYL